jgi:hypothetical protein
VRFISGAWQRDFLPCVFYKAHGKEKSTASKLFATRQEKNARQIGFFAVHFYCGARQSFIPFIYPTKPQIQ